MPPKKESKGKKRKKKKKEWSVSLNMSTIDYKPFLVILFQAIHNFFKEKLPFLVTDTIDGPEASSKCIRVRLNSGGSHKNGKSSQKRKDRVDKPFDSRGSDNWPEHVGKFLR